MKELKVIQKKNLLVKMLISKDLLLLQNHMEKINLMKGEQVMQQIVVKIK